MSTALLLNLYIASLEVLIDRFTYIMHNDAVILMEQLLQQASTDMEALQKQTALCMGDVQIVNALLDVQVAYTHLASVIEEGLKKVR